MSPTEAELQAARAEFVEGERVRRESALTFVYYGARRTRYAVDRLAEQFDQLVLEDGAFLTYHSELSSPGRYVFSVESYHPGYPARILDRIRAAYPRRRIVQETYHDAR